MRHSYNHYCNCFSLSFVLFYAAPSKAQTFKDQAKYVFESAADSLLVSYGTDAATKYKPLKKQTQLYSQAEVDQHVAAALAKARGAPPAQRRPVDASPAPRSRSPRAIEPGAAAADALPSGSGSSRLGQLLASAAASTTSPVLALADQGADPAAAPPAPIVPAKAPSVAPPVPVPAVDGGLSAACAAEDDDDDDDDENASRVKPAQHWYRVCQPSAAYAKCPKLSKRLRNGRRCAGRIGKIVGMQLEARIRFVLPKALKTMGVV